MPWYWVCRGSAWANLQSLTASDTDDLDSWHTPATTCEVLQLLQSMDAGELRVLAVNLMVTLQDKDQELVLSKTLNKKLTFEIVVLRRFRFGKRGEQLLPGAQGSLLEEAVDEDTEIETQLAALFPESDSVSQPNPLKRAALPPQLPHIEIRHEPHDENCPCGCRLTFVRDEISEKLDYTPGTFTVERHVLPILACPKVAPTWKINFFPDFFAYPRLNTSFSSASLRFPIHFSPIPTVISAKSRLDWIISLMRSSNVARVIRRCTWTLCC